MASVVRPELIGYKWLGYSLLRLKPLLTKQPPITFQAGETERKMWLKLHYYYWFLV